MSPGALGQIVAVVVAYGAVCAVFGAVFGMALGPSIAQAVLSFFRRR